MAWDADRYAKQFGFVPAYGRELIGLLAPQKDESILDLGCGTGALTAEIAATGAKVTGVDGDANMVALAKTTYPALAFHQQNAEQLSLTGSFDAVFSNAALHWMKIDKVFPGVAKILRRGGRFVAELGGTRNIAAVEHAMMTALEKLGHNPAAFPVAWIFPTPATLAAELEKAGFELRYSHLYDRPTPLDDTSGGLTGWVQMFGGAVVNRVPEKERAEFFRHLENAARPDLFHEGVWVADYRRQHFIAVKL